MSKLVIQTQHKENYAWVDGELKTGAEAHWKFKGGNTYVVENLSTSSINKIAKNGIPELTKLIEFSNDAFQEYIIDWEIAEDDAVGCESWETPLVLSFDQTHQEWTAYKFTDNRKDGWMRSEIVEQHEHWDMLFGNDRANYRTTFLMNDDTICHGQDELKAWLNKKEAA